MSKELEKNYDPQKYEDSIYKKWEESGFFNPDVCIAKNICESDADTFTVALPPPNITDKLHMGHVVMIAVTDILVRYYRMRGRRTLWIPGTDHAAIATQNVVEKKLLAEENKTRHDLGRVEFLARMQEFISQTQATIIHQLKKTGGSLDWTREAFTLDERRQTAVKKMFIDMYKDEVIYRGYRIVNWCPRCQSTLADDEVEHYEQDAKFYTFRYAKDAPFAISTTRPETKLGDTGVAVNPEDKRYQSLIGKTYNIDFCGVKLNLKIVADSGIDMKFGTGAVGVTPAHSLIDYEIAQKNDLPVKKVINEDGKMADDLNNFSGLSVIEARELVVELLKNNGLLEKEEDIKNNLSVCYRCHTAIEPLTSRQWFIGVDKKLKRLGNQSLKERAIAVAKENQLKFMPERFTKRYLDWMENLHDWCVSRQIWFGHRIPVYYDIFDQENLDGFLYLKKDSLNIDIEKCKSLASTDKSMSFITNIVPGKNSQNDIIVTAFNFSFANALVKNGVIKRGDLIKSIDYVEVGKCKKWEVFSDEKKIGDSYVQDPDTLDTWFSSGMWTFTTLGWPLKAGRAGESGSKNDLANYHPMQFMETGYEILTLWVSRMVMMSLFALDEIPFENVYLHGMVLDKHGKKMSKSKGNGIDPLDMISKYGTDATRLSLIVGSTPGNDMKLSEEKIAYFRNFTNKLWNIARFVFSIAGETRLGDSPELQAKTLADKWILELLSQVESEVTKKIESYDFSGAAEALKKFTWDEFADWYLEIAKIEGRKEDMLVFVLKKLLILWHPFMPFVTEAIWQEMNNERFLMVTQWPVQDSSLKTKPAKKILPEMEIIKNIVSALRNLRANCKISPAKKLRAVIYTENSVQLLKNNLELIKGLRTGVTEIEIAKKGEKISKAAYASVSACEIYIPLEGVIDLKKEEEKIKKQAEDLNRLIKGLEKKLDNADFVQRAPKDVVQDQVDKLELYQTEAKQLKNQLKYLK
ncbi:MAG: valine--tRNA ligase [bacterium]|nr:valine--tRNA ligase [bacterium]